MHVKLSSCVIAQKIYLCLDIVGRVHLLCRQLRHCGRGYLLPHQLLLLSHWDQLTKLLTLWKVCLRCLLDFLLLRCWLLRDDKSAFWKSLSIRSENRRSQLLYRSSKPKTDWKWPLFTFIVLTHVFSWSPRRYFQPVKSDSNRLLLNKLTTEVEQACFE